MSFEDLYRKHWTKMYEYFLYKLGGDSYQAEDLTSELFYLAYKKWDELRTLAEPQLVAWLFKAALLHVKQYWRESNRCNSVDLDMSVFDCEDIVDTSECFWEQLQDEDEKFHDMLRRLKQTLTGIELQVFVCRIEKKMSVLQTAQELGISPNNVMVRTYRMRQKLRPVVEMILCDDI